MTDRDDAALRGHLDAATTFEPFFAEAALYPSSSAIIGVVGGIRVENLEDPLMQRMIRSLYERVDELARGTPMEKILRS